ncbi:hypothetical protein [Nocardioides sp. T2.26MG-1]|uniref:hypothetical protein n=1 Tax=Nocardioides sp. T2.26MG-1 TaxID=3041166 RepID=UPI0024779A69|nr:hypothetical protein [Nocardioides sp. T2.26MG-1]CAI9405559.1 hypothetical protein HIDPHFAB_04409 [Nocardioides sp. T2.26MG-1]
MTTDSPPTGSLADRLLDAQVAFHLARLTGDDLATTVSRVAEDLLAASEQHPIEELVDREAAARIVSQVLAQVPGSAAAGALVELAVQVVYDGPAEAFPLGELADREQVAALLDELIALSPVLERGLERLTESPLVGTVASRFMGRIVGEVLQANKAVTDRVPGLGSLMSFGTTAASKMMGAADKQFEGLIGDTVGKGGTFAVRRLNKIIVETVRDPTTREAVLQVWDLVARQPAAGLSGSVAREELTGVVDAAHDLVATAAAAEAAAGLTAALVDAFFHRFGGYSPAELLDELDLDRADVVAEVARVAPPVVDALREAGALERIVRAQLAPFYDSAEVTTLLGG